MNRKTDEEREHRYFRFADRRFGNSSLRVERLRKMIGRKCIVDGVDLKMRSGEVVGLLGPNGAGKTTCFYMIAGFVPATDGRVFLNDAEITKLPMYKKAQSGIAYLPQETSIFRKLTVEENIYAVLESRKELKKTERKELLDFLLEEIGITEIRKQKAYTLSGGESRRTEIARALATNPLFLLMDEPFSGVDPIAVAELKEIIVNLTRHKIGVLLTDHNVRDALQIMTRSYILHRGRILAEGSLETILRNRRAREIYLGRDFAL